MRLIRTLIFVVLFAAIAVCGYMVYQEYFNQEQQPQEQTEQFEPQVTRLNDSTYHINLSDCSCVTLEKVCETLYIDGCGVNFIHVNGDTVRIGCLQTYVLNASDFYDSTRFENIETNLQE